MTRRSPTPSQSSKERFPKHMMGKHCGYDLYEDGSIQIAPSHADFFARAAREEEGLNLLIAAFNKHLGEQYARAAHLRNAFWELVREDYSLDFEQYDYSYREHDKRILRTTKPVEKKK